MHTSYDLCNEYASNFSFKNCLSFLETSGLVFKYQAATTHNNYTCTDMTTVHNVILAISSFSVAHILIL